MEGVPGKATDEELKAWFGNGSHSSIGIVTGVISGIAVVDLELLGHKSISMTMRYAHHYPESLRSSIDVLDRNYDDFTTVRSDLTEAKKIL